LKTCCGFCEVETGVVIGVVKGRDHVTSPGGSDERDLKLIVSRST
jgi:hypothetical protein